jgi:protein-tyrosine phosphatase
MGNICRSPSAEGFLRQRLSESDLGPHVGTDSAATHSYHIGRPPDSRAISEAEQFGVDISDLRARKIVPDDFRRFDLIISMDHHNEVLVRSMEPVDSNASCRLMMEYAPEPGLPEVPDPYYGSQSDFTYMCELLDQATRGLLADLEKRLLQ